MEKIKSGQEQIELFGRLKIEEAKELYKKAMNSSDEKLRKLYFDNLILGTLYVVYDYIERNGLELLQNSQYSIEDIQSAFTEIWIKKIKSGELLKVDRYLNLFNPAFFNDVYTNLVGSEMIISEQFGIETDHLINLFYLFIKLKNTGKEFTFDDLMVAFYQEKKYCCQIDDTLMLIFENMYNNLNFDKTEDLEITKNKIKNYIRLIINGGLYERISDDVAADECCDDILDAVMYESFINDVDAFIINEKRRRVIYERFGLNGGKAKTLEEIAKQFGVTRESIRQIESKTLRDLRRSKRIRRYS